MLRAIELSLNSANNDGGPFGCVITKKKKVIAEGSNKVTLSNDPTAHAEIVALRQAAKAVANHRVVNADVYVTIEPCTMCAGALVHARIERLIFGAKEPRAGAVCSSARVLDNLGLNHKVTVIEGVLEKECKALMSGFFQGRRI